MRGKHPTKKNLEHRRFIIPVVVTECIFIKIILKVLWANAMKNASGAIFTQRPETFNRVGVNVAHYINLV